MLAKPTLKAPDAAKQKEFVPARHADSRSRFSKRKQKGTNKKPLIEATPSIPVSQIETLTDYYLKLHCYSQSQKTIKGKRDVFSLLEYFCRWRGHKQCGEPEIVAFLDHLLNGHEEPLGRWGKGVRADGKRVKTYFKATTARTSQLYYDYLRAFFNSLVEDNFLHSSPMQRIKRPTAPKPEIVPFSHEQLNQLFTVAMSGACAERDMAIYYVIFGTGMRCEEVSNLNHSDIDLAGHSITVEGKGKKKRLVLFGAATAQALLAYKRSISMKAPQPDDPLFTCSRKNKGKRLSSKAIYQIFVRQGKVAGLQNVRCSPHTLRHTFATEFMMNHAPQKATMRQLGHSDPAMTLRYQHVNEAQLAATHKYANPADTFNDTQLSFRKSPQAPKRSSGRPRQPLENFPCTCGLCPDAPKKACPRGNVIIKRLQRTGG